MSRTTAIIMTLIIVGLIAGTVAWKLAGPRVDRNAIVVGAILPLSGRAAFLGQGTLNGLILAAEHANSGVWGPLPFRIQIVPEDDGGVPRQAVSAYRKLVSAENVRIVLTTLSSSALAIKPRAEEDGVLLFANASHPDITREARTTLRHSNLASQEARVFSDEIERYRPPTGVMIIAQNNDYGTAFAEALEHRLSIVAIPLCASDRYDDASFNAELDMLADRVRRLAPGAVVLAGSGRNLGLLIQRIREYGYLGEVYSTLGFVLSPGAVEAAGPHAIGIRYSRFRFDRDEPGYQRLAEDYRRRFGQEIAGEAVIAYNTIRLLVEAIEVVGTNPSRIAEHIRSLGTFAGAGELLEITSNGDIIPSLEIVPYTP